MPSEFMYLETPGGREQLHAIARGLDEMPVELFRLAESGIPDRSVIGVGVPSC